MFIHLYQNTKPIKATNIIMMLGPINQNIYSLKWYVFLKLIA